MIALNSLMPVIRYECPLDGCDWTYIDRGWSMADEAEAEQWRAHIASCDKHTSIGDLAYAAARCHADYVEEQLAGHVWTVHSLTPDQFRTHMEQVELARDDFEIPVSPV